MTPFFAASTFLPFVFAQADANKVVPPALPVHWYPETFGMAVLSTLAFGAIGIVLAILGFKLFDLLTPGNLDSEILQKQNIAAAILGGAIIVGICLIVAAAVG